MKNLTLIFAGLILYSCSDRVDISKKYPVLQWSEAVSEAEMKLDKETTEGELTASKFKFNEDSSFKLLSVERLNDVDETRARKLIGAKNLLIRESYETQPTPYSGSVTKEASCFEGIQITPKEIENENQISYRFNLKATERFVTGVCVEEQNVFRSQILHLYCKKNKTLFDMKIYYDKSSPLLTDEIAQCL